VPLGVRSRPKQALADMAVSKAAVAQISAKSLTSAGDIKLKIGPQEVCVDQASNLDYSII